MTDKKVNLIISLKDGVSSGLSEIRRGLSSARTALNDFGKAGIAMGAMVVAGLGAVLKAYANQESANARLAATFKAVGESGSLAVARFGAFASKVQQVTTVGDDTTLSLVTLAKTMGISNDRIEGAVQGAIGLSKAFGLDLPMAMKMTALAMNGEYEMLGRYIPSLRTATTEAEKQATVQRAMADGFIVAQDEVKTINGAWEAFKNAFGDSLEVFGEGLFGDGGFVTGITNLRLKIQELAADGTLKEWAENTKQILTTIASLIGKVVDGWGMLIRGYQKAAAFTGALAGNIMNPSREDKTMIDIIKTAAKQTQEITKPIINEGKKESEKIVQALSKNVEQRKMTTEKIADAFKKMDEVESQKTKTLGKDNITGGGAVGSGQSSLSFGIGRNNGPAGYFTINKGNEEAQLEWAKKKKAELEGASFGSYGLQWDPSGATSRAKRLQQQQIGDLNKLIDYLSPGSAGNDQKNPMIDIATEQTEYLKKISERVGGIR